MSSGPAVQITDLSLNYHVLEGETVAIKSLFLEVQPAEFVSIIGPSGCGKSTLLSILSGLLTPSGGEVLINGQPVRGPSPRIGYMPQRDHLFEWLNIWQNVTIGLKVQKKMHPEALQFVDNLLTTYGLGEFKYHYPNQLSGGMRQRVSLIRTLAINPDILLLDEPFSSLDYQTRLLVADEVKNIIIQEQKTALFVTHDIAEAISMADRVVVLSKRPARVKTSHEIHLASTTPLKRREDPGFKNYFNTIWKELDIHV